MEYSAGDAVPYLDRVPAGVVEMVRSAGAEVVTSADLVTRIYAVWTPEDLASHKRAAEHLARIARNAMALAGERARSGKPISEYELMMLIREEFSEANLVTDSHGPNVSVGRSDLDGFAWSRKRGEHRDLGSRAWSARRSDQGAA